MEQKVEFFCDESEPALERKINEFAKTHHIESISYTISVHGYSDFHHCCVLYTDKY